MSNVTLRAQLLNAGYQLRILADWAPSDWQKEVAVRWAGEAVRAAVVDTHAKRGDSTQIEAPSPMGSAVGEAETPARSRQSNKPGREM